ncbi:MAG TPA: D-sedoheptulose 7-phosphate isomerase [Bdellovibrionota bacterium]|nr:D-sedoheptulose 7-phosphate isomerase [Bdellovibrionota bacterium]
MQNKQEIQRLFEESIRVKQDVARTMAGDIDRAVQHIVRALSSGKKILFFGNGGSAADSQHLAAEFIGRFRIERNPLPALALTTDTSILTAIGNDYGFEDVFSRQIIALGNPGDVAIGISTSGNSPNVLKAVSVAKERQLLTIGMTGGSGGKLGEKVDIHLNVGSTTNTARIQECHITIGHIIMELVDQELVLGKRREEGFPLEI